MLGGLVTIVLLWLLAFDELSTYAAWVNDTPWLDDVVIRMVFGLKAKIPSRVFESISAQAT